jgi:hypothetical protein
MQYGAEKIKGSHVVSTEGPTFMDVKGSSLGFYGMIGFAFQ